MLRSGKIFRKDNGESSCDDINLMCHPVLMTDLALQNIFQYLDFASLRNCRAVCRKWKNLTRSQFKQNATVVCKQTGNIAMLRKLFPKNPNKISFNSLTLKEIFLNRKTISRFKTFFRNEGRSIEELKLEGLKCSVDAHMDALVTPKMRALHISSDYFTYLFATSVVSVYLEQNLLTLDFIKLKNVTVYLTDKCAISPVELILLDNTQIVRMGEYSSSNVSASEFINFDRLEKLTLKVKNVSLNFEGSKSLKYLELVLSTENMNQVDPVNWSTSNWSVDTMKLEHCGFTERTGMNITNLEIRYSTVNLSVLPGTIKKLILLKCKITCDRYSCIHLNQLTCLRFVHNNHKALEYFHDCDKLTELSVYHSRGWGMLNLDFMPRNVRQLTLDYENKLQGVSRLSVDTLLLKTFPLDFWDNNQLSGRHLIVLTERYCSSNFAGLVFDRCFTLIHKLIANEEDESCQKITLGAFYWKNESSFKKSRFFNIVDRMAEYYTFTAGDKLGRAIKINQIPVCKEALKNCCEMAL